MLTNYYDVYYINGDRERLWRQEESMLACKLGNKKIKSIKYRRYTENGWKEKVIV